jgi:2'-5' RNA ligase
MKRYSIVFMPPTGQVAYVKSKKDALFSTIGGYNSRNAKAHITVLEFEASERRLKEAITYLEQFCRSVKPFHVRFNGLEVLGSALCLLPSMQSKAFLSAVMQSFAGHFPLHCFTADNPHITIGRRLAKAQLGLGRQRFASEKPDIAFEADGLYLRRFNESRGQYDVIGKFAFLGERTALPKIVVQPTLFD